MGTADDATPSRLMEMPSWLISQTSMHAHQLLTDAFAMAGSRGYHYRLLAALKEFGPASQAALGRHTSIDRSDVVAALNDLTDGGLVERSPDPTDRRRNVISITRAGAAAFKRLDGILVEVQNELLAPLSSTDRQLLIRILTRVLEYHRNRQLTR